MISRFECRQGFRGSVESMSAVGEREAWDIAQD